MGANDIGSLRLRHGQNERELALNRKNALFAGHDEGAENWGRIASLIETCKLNHVNPNIYLQDVLETIVNGHKQSKIDELMPSNHPSPKSKMMV